MAAIKKRSLVDQVYEVLRRDIITLRRPLGSKLNVNELQEELEAKVGPAPESAAEIGDSDEAKAASVPPENKD